MRKPLIKALVIVSLILMMFTSCDENVYTGERVHSHWYYVQSDGAWQCKCGHVLEGTEKPYITYIRNSQPTEIIDLTVDPPINVVVGVGNLTLNEAGTEMAYTNSGTTGQEVYLRTNSSTTDLTINAAPDVVHHYGTIGLITIEAIAGSSYHEKGKAAFAQIKNGRMVLESGSDVRQVLLKRTGTEEEGKFDNITIAKADDVSLPNIVREPIKVSETGTLVVALQDGTAADTDKDYYWLTAVGVYEQVVVSDNNTSTETTTEETVYASESSNEEHVITAHYIANTFTSNPESAEEEVRVSAKPKTTDEKGKVTEWSYVVTDSVSGEVNTGYEALKQTDNTINIKNVETQSVDTKKTNGIKEEEVADAISNAKDAAVAVEEAEQEERELIHVNAKVPTCTEVGHTAYDYYMNGEIEVPIGKVVIPALGHYFVSRWTSDETYHWHECSHSCGTVSEKSEHSYPDSWSYDDTDHWHECSVCGHKKDEAEHTLSWEIYGALHRQVCECGYSTEYQDHSFSTWAYDESKHWQVCECGAISDKADHSLTWNHNSTQHWEECSCGYKTTAENHSYSSSWSSDSTGHWHECDVCHAGDEVIAHTEPEEWTYNPTTQMNEKRCTICDYLIAVEGHVHSYSTSWSSDSTGHWHECTVCHAKDSVVAHTESEWQYDSVSGKDHTVCTICNYEIQVRDHVHSYTWTYDDVYHWQVCTVCNHETTHEEHDLTILFKPGTGANTVVAETACANTSCTYPHTTSDDFPSTTGAFSLSQSYNGVFAQRTGESTWTVSVSDEIKNTYASCKWFNSDCSEQLPNTSTDFSPIEVTIQVDGTTEWVRVYCLYYDSGNNLAGGGYVDICK